MMLGVAFGGMGSLLSGANLLKMGFMAASALGMYLLNGNKEKGQVARLDDLKVSSSTYGRGIPIAYGTMRVTGNMFWATDFDEVLKHANPKNKGGKKGEKKGTPYYEYYANYAMMLCEGPVEELLRVWADSNLIYDKHNPKNPDLVKVGFSRQESGGGKSGMGMNKKKGGQGGDSGRFSFRFYSGTESQLADPFMVKKQGVDMVPAHRGSCYLFFEKFALMDFGNRTPTITAEVSVRKKMEVTFDVLSNLPGASEFRLPTSPKSEVDPERYKLYNLEIHNPTNEWYIRVYDLSSNKEVRRISFNEINQINFPEGGENSISAWVGLAGTGDLIFRCNPFRNVMPIGFFDPNTFALKRSLFGGARSMPIQNGPNHIVLATASVACTYIYVDIKISGEVEIVPKRATLVTSMGAWFYVFDEDHNPMTYFTLPFGFSTNASYAVPTGVEIFGGQFHITMDANTSNHSELWRVDWAINMEMDPAGKPIGPILLTPTEPAARVIRELTSPPFQSVGIVHPSLITGAEVIGWLEVRAVDDPLQRGLWAIATDAKDPHARIIWEERIDSDPYAGPTGFGSNTMRPTPVNTGSFMKWMQKDRIWTVDFRMRKVSYYSTGNKITSNLSSSGQQMYWPARGAILFFINDPTDNKERKWCMGLIDRNTQTPVDVHFIINDLAKRVGISADKVDLTKLKKDEITGYLIENPTSARKVVEQLSQLFMFDVVESDYRLKVISRGQTSINTIKQKDLGIIDNDTRDHFSETRVQEIDLPQTVVVSYINAEKDYNVNSQHYRRPRSPMPVMQSKDKLEIQLPMAMDADFGKQLAHKICMSLWSERINYELLLPWKYMPYDPADVIRYEMDDGLVFETRMMKMDLGANFSIEATGVTQTPAAYVSDIKAGDVGGTIPAPKPWPPQTEPYAANVPYLHDEDNLGNGQWGYYFGSGALGPGFQAAAVEFRVAGLDWALAGLVSQEIIWGSVTGAVPPPPHGPFATDDVNTIILNPAHPFEDESGYTYSWESIPQSSWPSTENTIIIGEEIIYFRDAEVLHTGQVKISHLIRGARGTEGATKKHKQNEKFCVVTEGLLLHNESFAYINQPFMFRSFSTYSILPPFRKDVFMEGATHKPWAPNYFRRNVDGSNIRIRWERRTRLGGEMRDGTNVIPLNEETETYELYILNAPYNPDFFDANNPSTYMRAFLNVTDKNVLYTQTMRTADGFNSNGPLYVVAFQVSAHVGRGFAGHATLQPSILI